MILNKTLFLHVFFIIKCGFGNKTNLIVVYINIE